MDPHQKKLSRTHKEFIVTALAKGYSINEVVGLFNDHFPKVQITRKTVENYNPGYVYRRREIHKDLVALYDREFDAYLEAAEHTPIANMHYRQALRHRLMMKMLDQQRWGKVRELLTEAQKESGRMYERGATGTKEDPWHLVNQDEAAAAAGIPPGAMSHVR